MDERGSFYPGAHARVAPEAPALVPAAGGPVIDYSVLDGYANRVSRVLRSQGVEAEDHVVLWMENSVNYPMTWWGAHYAGTYYTPMSTRLTVGEAAHIVADSGAKSLIVSAGMADERLTALAREFPRLQILIAGGTHAAGRSLDELAAAESSDSLADAVDGSVMLYSSGTTGVPKAVKRPMAGVSLGSVPGVAPLAHALFGIGPGSVYLSPAPLHHAAPFGFVTAVTAIGGSAVVMHRFDPEGLLAAIERHRVTHVQLVPTMFNRLLALPESVKERYEVGSLVCVIHAAAPCPIPVKERMITWWGPIIHEYYSGTEAAGFTHCSPNDWPEHKGSVGRPLMGAIHIVDESGQEAPVGEVGAIYFAHGAQFEYHNDPDKTADSHLGKWATMGDIGRVDEDGFLYLTDRRSDLIIRGGVNVYPQEAENLLATHPSVFDVAVFGVPDPDLGEEVKAVVQPAAGVTADDALAEELIAFCRRSLAGFKCPRTVDFRPELPRDDTGKLFKRLLRDEYRWDVS
jgi:long-chain acyl-CoA synthetase